MVNRDSSWNRRREVGPVDDKKLSRALRRGDRRALDKAMDAYTHYLSVVAWNALGPDARREDVEEIVSDTFLALWRNREGLDPEQNLKAYLAAIARNRAADRRRAARPAPVPLNELDESPVPGPQEELERRAFAAALWDAVTALPDIDRALVEGYYFEGERLQDLAGRLGLTPGGAKTRLCRARKALKKTLEKEGLTREAE